MDNRFNMQGIDGGKNNKFKLYFNYILFQNQVMDILNMVKI